MEYNFKVKNTYYFECYGPDGKLKWTDKIDNLVPTLALNYIIEAALLDGIGAVYDSSDPRVCVGLVASAPSFSSTDTMASHAGWTEVEDYSEATRPEVLFGNAVNGSMNNLTSRSIFTFNNTVNIDGAFLCLGDNTKGGTSGLLFGAGKFNDGNSYDVIASDKLFLLVISTITS